ncbi:YunG family protein [Paraburkholderia sp. CI3]|uniref:YunG family protein n=1 Tax=Paraburkholderia sp. CI3 TaxID=2991060 RepID=UPI003D207682
MTQEAQTPAVSKPFATPIDLYRVLARVWAGDTSSPTHAWSSTNPAQNHCSVTSLIMQDYFGGEILTTRTSGGTHFYNLIDGSRWDLTVSQFAEPIPFDDTRSSREAAFADTSREKYELLKSRLAQSQLK